MAAALPGEKSMSFGPSALRLIRMLRPERAMLLVAGLCGVGSVALSVEGPRLLGRVTDLVFAGLIGKHLPAGVSKAQAIADLRASGHGSTADLIGNVPVRPGQGVDFTAVAHILGITLAVYLGAFCLTLIQGRLVTYSVQHMVFRLRRDAAAKLSRLPLSYFDGQPRGEVLSRATNDIDNVAQTLAQTMSQLFTSLLTITGVLAMMFWISPLLALVALVSVPISITTARFIGRRAQPQFVKQWASTGRLNGHIEETYTGHALVKAFGRAPESAAAFAVHNEALYRSAYRAQFISGFIQPAMSFVGNIGYVLVAVVGGLRVSSGVLTLGQVQAFVQYSRQFNQPVIQVASMANLLQSGVASAERVFEFLDAAEQSPDPAPLAAAGAVRGRVAFEAASFRYNPDVPLIEGLSLAVEPGRTVAIVGPTGAGKTTLVNLLMRFYELDSGRILLDGQDIAAMPRGTLRAHIGMVLQDTWLFSGTIAENIAYGVPGATREQIVAAAKATHVDHFVRTLPGGYDTVLDPDEAALSAGERQLVTIARAFLADPAILVLDEATSFVDSRTELLIQQGTASLRAGRTSFVIAHRLSTIRDADLILVMQDGRIVEQGKHAELLERAGVYAGLHSAQFARPAAEPA
jgi:ATP-binding cassette subfamily B protein